MSNEWLIQQKAMNVIITKGKSSQSMCGYRLVVAMILLDIYCINC